jgi:hypothetical protein
MDKTFGSGNCKMNCGARRGLELGLTAFVRNFNSVISLREGGSKS